MLRNRWKVLAFAGLGVVLLAAGCGDSHEDADDDDDAPLGFVGTVEGTDAFVSVIVADSATEADEAVVYICDGDAELREWFRGPVDDPTNFELSNDAGASVTAELADESFSGQFTTATGSVHGFDAVKATGEAGLYEVDDEQATAADISAAWVVDNDGNERGAWWQRVSFIPTQPLSTTTFRLSRFSVTNGILGMNGIIAPNN